MVLHVKQCPILIDHAAILCIAEPRIAKAAAFPPHNLFYHGDIPALWLVYHPVNRIHLAIRLEMLL